MPCEYCIRGPWTVVAQLHLIRRLRHRSGCRIAEIGSRGSRKLGISSVYMIDSFFWNLHNFAYRPILRRIDAGSACEPALPSARLPLRTVGHTSLFCWRHLRVWGASWTPLLHNSNNVSAHYKTLLGFNFAQLRPTASAAIEKILEQMLHLPYWQGFMPAIARGRYSDMPHCNIDSHAGVVLRGGQGKPRLHPSQRSAPTAY